MRYAIISDIHGNLAAFKRAVADAKRQKCDKIVCLGDLTGYGKQSRECVDFAMSHVDVCLMGNHDSVCCGKERPLEFISNRNYDIDLATRKLLTREQLSWLAMRPYIWCGPGFACVHGEFSSPSDWFYVTKPKDAWQSLWTRSEQVLFVGHTHVPFIMKLPANKVKLSQSFDEEEAVEGMRGLTMLKASSCVIASGARYVVNVGSVGIPRHGSSATYCVLMHKQEKFDSSTYSDTSAHRRRQGEDGNVAR